MLSCNAKRRVFRTIVVSSSWSGSLRFCAQFPKSASVASALFHGAVKSLRGGIVFFAAFHVGFRVHACAILLRNAPMLRNLCVFLAFMLGSRRDFSRSHGFEQEYYSRLISKKKKKL